MEILHHFSDQHPEGLSTHPWPDSSAHELAEHGNTNGPHGHSSRTPLIPVKTAEALFSYAESVLLGADVLLDEREAGVRPMFKDPEVNGIRDACFYLIGCLTGMRCSEIVGIEVGAGRTEKRHGHTFHWVRSIEHKTFKGQVEYMMPSIGHEILRVMERWSAPFRQILSTRLATSLAMEPHLRAAAISDQHRIFLGKKNNNVNAVSNEGWHTNMRRLASRAGTDWKLSPHQLRRLYAWTFVRHKLGNLLFLKEQFKHTSVNMSQLYASNPQQDAALYDDIHEELERQKVDVIESWIDNAPPLAGGAGKRIMHLRAHDFPNRKALIVETSRQLQLRSTGHGWCLAQDSGCGGQGLYERTLCTDCGNGVIDQSFTHVWRALYREQLALIDDAQLIGPGALQRVQRDIAKSRQVLQDLNLESKG